MIIVIKSVFFCKKLSHLYLYILHSFTTIYLNYKDALEKYFYFLIVFIKFKYSEANFYVFI